VSGAWAEKGKAREVLPPPQAKLRHFRFGKVNAEGQRFYQCRLNVPGPVKHFYLKGFEEAEHQTRAERSILIWNGEDWKMMPPNLRPVFFSDSERGRYESEKDIHGF
jgi:hypothetical protein